MRDGQQVRDWWRKSHDLQLKEMVPYCITSIRE